MFKFIENIGNQINNKLISMENSLFDIHIRKLKLICITNNNFNYVIKHNPNPSKMIIIDHYSFESNDTKYEYFILCFDDSIKIIDISDSIIYPFLYQYQNSTLYYFSNGCITSLKTINPKFYNIYLKKKIFSISDITMKKFLDQFKINKNKHDQKTQEEWKIIQKCISSYLITKSFSKGVPDKFNFEDIDKPNKFILLKTIGSTATSIIELKYCIEQDKCLIVKKINQNDYKSKEIIKRESQMYEIFEHSFLAKYIGYCEKKNYLMIEYINGQTLDKYDIKSLTECELFNIIFELMIVIHYIHLKGYVYRDLKPNNIMINKNNFVKLIDLNSVKSEKEGLNEDNTCLGSEYIPPETAQNKYFTKESDIFSLGLIISELFDQYPADEFQSAIQTMIEACTKEDCKKRPNISQLIRYYYINILSKLKQKQNIESMLVHIWEDNYKNQNIVDPMDFCTLGIMHFEGSYIPKNDYKSCLNFEIAAMHNDLVAQVNLGFFNLSDDFDLSCKCINNAKYQNDPLAYVLLAMSKFSNTNKNFDIFEIIEILENARKLNFQYARFMLIFIYFSDSFGVQDKQKCIDYLEEADKHKNDKFPNDNKFLDVKGKYILPNKDLKILYDFFTWDIIQIFLDVIREYFHTEDQSTSEHRKVFKYLGKYKDYKLMTLNDFMEEHKLEKKSFSSEIIDFIQSIIVMINYNIANMPYYIGANYLIGRYGTKEVGQAIQYFKIAVSYKSIYATCHLAVIYSLEQYSHVNIKEAIKLFNQVINDEFQLSDDYHRHFLKSEQYMIDKVNFISYKELGKIQQVKIYAHLYLSLIYYEGKYQKQDVDKCLKHLTYAANLNDPLAQFFLGVLYIKGKNIEQNIGKALEYLHRSADNKYEMALVLLGLYYYTGFLVKEDINKAIKMINDASSLNNHIGFFYKGIFHLEGLYVELDESEAIRCFKEASNRDNQCAKNNLGILYKNKFIINSKEYFEEAIRHKNDEVARFNLAHIYFFGEGIMKDLDNSTRLLTEPTRNKIPYSIGLLSLIMVEKCNLNLKLNLSIIENEFKKYNEENYIKMAKNVFDRITSHDLYNPMKYKALYEKMKKIELIYVHYNFGVINCKGIYIKKEFFGKNKNEPQLKNHQIDINELFLEGFGQMIH